MVARYREIDRGTLSSIVRKISPYINKNEFLSILNVYDLICYFVLGVVNDHKECVYKKEEGGEDKEH
ncbi:MAG: hypothetical protein B6D57_03650 [Candidatus Coatesbacteria bacterium 4484_99]|uniref:Uncharacterized protein n=1 Tax=Candidatus Coatesbacteria bacterium 4484_99 TaxID=1970774 RepID=A0A1W9S0T1_9BACT|nr:MAG: hypothetical protein B6D57_03650 [Candidatus Coatesbacteria bacterium 4484_99]